MNVFACMRKVQGESVGIRGLSHGGADELIGRDGGGGVQRKTASTPDLLVTAIRRLDAPPPTSSAQS